MLIDSIELCIDLILYLFLAVMAAHIGLYSCLTDCDFYMTVLMTYNRNNSFTYLLIIIIIVYVLAIIFHNRLFVACIASTSA